jgi:hypothetical protein
MDPITVKAFRAILGIIVAALTTGAINHDLGSFVTLLPAIVAWSGVEKWRHDAIEKLIRESPPEHFGVFWVRFRA